MTVYELRFWTVFVLISLMLLLLFFFWKPRLALWAVPICAALDFLFHMGDFFYYESRGLALLLTAVHAAVIAVPALAVRLIGRKKR